MPVDESAAQGKGPQQPIRVLIVDDHVLVGEGTRRLIELEGDMRAVGIARNGIEALAMVASEQPNVVLMDIEMPEMDGIEATALISQQHPDVAVLVLSAYDDDEYVERLVECGAAGYMLKDVRGEQLVEAIRGVHRGESALHPRIARKVMRNFGAHRAEEGEPDRLSERELYVLRMAARGLGNEAIALRLGISSRTVQAHLSNIFSKMQVESRTQAVVEALRRRWIRLNELGP